MVGEVEGGYRVNYYLNKRENDRVQFLSPLSFPQQITGNDQPPPPAALGTAIAPRVERQLASGGTCPRGALLIKIIPTVM